MSEEDAQNAESISAGDTKTAVIKEEGGMAIFRFVPEKTGWYSFTSVTNGDTYGYLYMLIFNSWITMMTVETVRISSSLKY